MVSWGFSNPRASLNPRIIGNKLIELKTLRRAGVPAPRTSQERMVGWIPRSAHHRSGDDLAEEPTAPDYWVEPVSTDVEFRVHIFRDLSIRVGMKLPHRPDHHPWIRSVDLGWIVSYCTVAQAYITEEVRQAARDAVKALEYDFGAVDVAVDQTGKPIVWEVNTAPGLLNGKTADAYARHIVRVLG